MLFLAARRRGRLDRRRRRRRERHGGHVDRTERDARVLARGGPGRGVERARPGVDRLPDRVGLRVLEHARADLGVAIGARLDDAGRFAAAAAIGTVTAEREAVGVGDLAADLLDQAGRVVDHALGEVELAAAATVVELGAVFRV